MNPRRKGLLRSRFAKLIRLIGIAIFFGAVYLISLQLLGKPIRNAIVRNYKIDDDSRNGAVENDSAAKIIRSPHFPRLLDSNISHVDGRNSTIGIPLHRVLANWKDLLPLLCGMIPGKPIVATIANSAFKHLLMNWYHHVQKTGMKNVLIVTLDEDLHKECKEKEIRSLLLSGVLKKIDFRKDGKAFRSMGALKSAFILTVLEYGWDVIMSDTDVVWVSSAEDFFSPRGEMGAADALISSDSVSISNDIASMQQDPSPAANLRDRQDWYRYATPRAREIFGNVYEHALNTGVLFFRSTSVTVKFCKQWHEVLRTSGKSEGWARIWGDQHALNMLMRARNMFPIKVVEPPLVPKRHNRIFWAYNHTLKLGILPPAGFCNGHVYFVQRTPQRLNMRVYAVHNTFQFHFGEGKIARFRDEGLWLEDPIEYYTEGNYLSFDVTIPKWIEEMPLDARKHKAAMEYYYEATRKALAIAKISNRTLILPKVLCYCERWWDSETAPCRAPGSDVDPPFHCPVDHFIDLQFWEWSKANYRTSRFLEDSRVSPAIKQSKVSLLLRDDDSSGMRDVRLRVNATDSEVVGVMKMLGNFRLVHLPNAINSFCRFEHHTENSMFDLQSSKGFLLRWCCTPEHGTMNFSIPAMTSISLRHCNR